MCDIYTEIPKLARKGVAMSTTTSSSAFLAAGLTIGLVLATGATAFADPPTRIDDPAVQAALRKLSVAKDPGCLGCHGAIENATENMGFELACTGCHGGDPEATEMAAAHVQPSLPVINDQTVPPLDYDLPYQRFVNPSNLRVVDQVCALCHAAEVEVVEKGLMATSAGHHAGGLWLNGVVDGKTPIYGTFAVSDDDGVVPWEDGAVASLMDLITYDPSADPNEIATHYAAVPGQGCARCHLWSRGNGYRGAVGKDGIYRADGCGACHMVYDDDGRSHGADTTIDHDEQGHPEIHQITKAIPTKQCLHCHHRGARIGLSFTGRAQMPPRLPSGAGVAGTTDVRFNGNFHFADVDVNPPDVHHERGLACIDCHVKAGIMGDGNIFGHMDQATKIECRTCHGMPGVAAEFVDHDGNVLGNADTSGAQPVLVSKVDGTTPPVEQVMNVVDPSSESYSPRAAAAMNANHLKEDGGLECYTCHSSWLPNCFGCHFERDEQVMGRNMVTREWEVGKITTNNKIFEVMRPFSLGPNSEGRVAPYVVGCQAIADVTAPDGSKILDFVMPETASGISGLALQPVNPHTVRSAGEVRGCVECHRASPSLGLGSGNFALARKYAFAVGDAAVRVLDRGTDPASPVLIASLPVTAPRAIATVPNIVHGSTDYLYAASADGVSVFDLRNGIPDAAAATIAGVDAVDVSFASRYLYVVEAGVGVRIYDEATPGSLALIATAQIPDAVRAVPWGIHLFVAAGEAGLVVVDVSDHTAPVIAGLVDGVNAVDVALYAHYQPGTPFAARAYVADPDHGVWIVELLPDWSSPRLLSGIELPGAAAVDTYTRYLPADGTTPSREHDYLYVAAGDAGLHVFDVTSPDAVFTAGALTLGGHAADVEVASQIAPPGVDDYAVVANTDLGVQLVDVTDPPRPSLVATVGSGGVERVFVEVQQLDRFLDEQGNQLKENSHPFTGTLDRDDIVRLLSTPLDGQDDVACYLPAAGCAEMTVAECNSAGGRPAAYGAACGGAILGTVTDAATGEPIPGITVRIWDAGGAPAASGLTDATGLYAAGGLEAGSYFAVASRSGYLDELYQGSTCPGSAMGLGCDPTSGLAILVSPDSTTQGVDFMLSRVLGTCRPSNTSMCLNSRRFQVEVEWRDFNDNIGQGEVARFGSNDSGLFYFFNADNWEMLVKVLDGCTYNGRFWVFAAATTNVEYTLRVTDTQTGATKSYFNPLGRASPAITDTAAFDACP